jgi:hypothetical protein
VPARLPSTARSFRWSRRYPYLAPSAPLFFPRPPG